MRLVERTMCLGALRITSNLACPKECVLSQSVSAHTIVLLLFTDVCVTGYLFICWFADLQLTNDQEVISLRFAAFLNETYNAVTFLSLALIAAETHLASRPQRMPAWGGPQGVTHPTPASPLLPLVNGVYALLCWTIAASYAACHYLDDAHAARQCPGGRPLDHYRCLRGFHLPDPVLALAEVLVATSYAFCRSLCAGGSEVRLPVSAASVPSGAPSPGVAPGLPLQGGHRQAMRSPPATQPGILLTGLVASLMLFPGLPYLGLTAAFISGFEHLSRGFFVQLSNCSQHGKDPGQSAPYKLIHALLNIGERKGHQLLESGGRHGEAISLPTAYNSTLKNYPIQLSAQ
ncbi:uncharacterized protein LOC144486764 [Mustelus asterias]